eukprot:1852494-Pleurochrysis_carterae.AAC.3
MEQFAPPTSTSVPRGSRSGPPLAREASSSRLRLHRGMRDRVQPRRRQSAPRAQCRTARPPRRATR